PFPRPPFPNEWCNKQPKIARVFSVPKNKYDPTDPKRRMIFDFSFPFPFSKNDLTPRTDSQEEWWKFHEALILIARLGKGTIMFFADVKAAYKLLEILPKEWFLQVFKTGRYYYLDKAGIFGDVAAGDNYDVFMRVDLAITRAKTCLQYLNCYVDNFSNFTPPV